jgi:hypothetical protein
MNNQINSPVISNSLENIKQTYNAGIDGSKQVINSAMQSVENATDNVRNTINSITTPPPTASQMSSDFFSSNSIITKFAFVILVVIVFLILLKLGIVIIGNWTEPSNNPYLIKGVSSGSLNYTISRNPKNKNSVQLLRSNNEDTGAEFTWSVWLNVVSTNTKNNNLPYSHIFNVGNAGIDKTTGLLVPNNAPGLYLTSVKQGYLALHVVMDTQPYTDKATGKQVFSKTVDIDEIPYNKWVHVCLRLENTGMDIYINGTISSRINFETVPKQNFYDVNICNNGGFQGSLSNLQYFDRALDVFQINHIVHKGPDLSAPVINGSSVQPPGIQNKNYDYISNLWYFEKL